MLRRGPAGRGARAREQLDRLPTPLAKAQLGAALALAHDQPRADAAFAAALAAPGRRWWAYDYGTALRDQVAIALLLKASGPPARGWSSCCPLCPAPTFARHAVHAGAVLGGRAGAVLGRNGAPARIALDGHDLPPAPVVSVGADRTRRRTQPGRPAGVARRLGHRHSRQPSAGSARRRCASPRQFKTLDGQPLDLDHLKQNTVFVLLLEGQGGRRPGAPRHDPARLPAGWEIAGRLAGGDAPGMPWLGKLSEPEAQPAADDRYAAVVALTPEAPDFRLAVRVRAVTPGPTNCQEPRCSDMYAQAVFARQAAAHHGRSWTWQPAGAPTIRSPHAGSRCSRSPCGKGAGGGGCRSVHPPPPAPSPRGRGAGCDGRPPASLRSFLPRSELCSILLPPRPFPPRPRRHRGPRPPGPRRWRCSRPRAASGASAPAPRPPLLTDLLIAVEDRRFWYHPGVDPLALVRATAQLVRTGHVVSGGSTLAMQAARLLEPRPRTLRSKLIEMARALQLEARYGREGVLDIWLTLAPFGGNLEGIRAGSLAWFGVPPEALEPAAGRPAGRHPPPSRTPAPRPPRRRRAAAVRDRVLAVGVRAGLFDADGHAGADRPRPRCLAMRRNSPPRCRDLRRSAPRWTCRCRRRWNAWGRSGWKRCRRMPRSRCWWPMRRAREIRALYPGAWRDQARAGAHRPDTAVRSPGSALKPFIYAMAFADGIAAPDTVVPDLPRRFGGYAPENFDRGFAGSVTAADALRRSLNLPAVALLDRVGPLRFAATLRAAGATLRLPHGADPSLPLALGGDGITLRDAAALYAALATDGTGGPLRLLAGAAAATARLPRRQCRARGGRCADPPAAGFRPARHRLEDRHQLGRARRLGVWFRLPPCRRGMDRTAGRHAVAGRHRHLARAAAAVARVRPSAEGPAQRDAIQRDSAGQPAMAADGCICCSRRRGRCCRRTGR